MANIMSLADVRNKPSREGFDLSFIQSFSAKVGEVLPIAWKYVLPGDIHDIDMRDFARTAPVNTASFGRAKEYYDFYFVPFEQLWRFSDSAMTQMLSNLQHSSGPFFEDNLSLSGELPYITASQIVDYIVNVSTKADERFGPYVNNAFGFDRTQLTCKLLEYLGYGKYYDRVGKSDKWATKPLLNNPKMCIFPLLAYQKIYSDAFRYTQWEKTNPSTFNVDYIKGQGGDTEVLAKVTDTNDNILNFIKESNFFDVRYCNYQKDLFHGVIPVAQYGEASVAIVSGSLAVVPAGKSDSYDVNSRPSFNITASSFLQGGKADLQLYAPSSGNIGLLNYDNGSISNSVSWNDPKLRVVGDAGFGLPILALRQAEFLQKWKEIAVSGEEDYKSQIQRHWGVDVSEYLSHSVRRLGGIDNGLDISEVTNQNLADDNAATLAGRGVLRGNGHIHFESKGEYGVLMCVYHSLPMLDYCMSGVDGQLLACDATDFPIPELDKIGMESVPIVKAINPAKSDAGGISPNMYLGYAPRYIDWKTSIDRAVGAFGSSLKTWVIPMDDKAFLAADSVLYPNNPNVEANSIGAGFFKVNPKIADSMFAVAADSTVDTDHIWSNAYFQWHCVRNLDKNGLPY